MRYAIILILAVAALVSARAEEPKLTEEELLLFKKLGEQDGNTDGYPANQQYNIDEHEPAKSIIKLGGRAIPELMAHLRISTKTKAHWQGRSSYYVLTVGDIVTLILGHVGGEKELKFLERREAWMKKIWHDARDYKDNQPDWSDGEKTEYMDLFPQESRTLTLWSTMRLRARLKIPESKEK